MAKILIIGLGEIGSANARYISSLKKPRLAVVGCDINPAAVARAVDENLIHKGMTVSDFTGYDTYMVCVSTHNPKNMAEPDLTAVHHVMEAIRQQAPRGALVCMESTIPVGTCRSLMDQHYRSDLHIVHVPERYFGPESDIHGVNQKRVFGALNPCCAKVGQAFYRDTLGIPLHPVPEIEYAEASKISENAYRYALIGIAEEHWMWAVRRGLDPDILRAACNTKWNQEYLEPRQGIGGPCLPKDSEMYLAVAGSDFPSIIRQAKEIDALYRKHKAGQFVYAK